MEKKKEKKLQRQVTEFNALFGIFPPEKNKNDNRYIRPNVQIAEQFNADLFEQTNSQRYGDAYAAAQRRSARFTQNEEAAFYDALIRANSANQEQYARAYAPFRPPTADPIGRTEDTSKQSEEPKLPEPSGAGALSSSDERALNM